MYPASVLSYMPHVYLVIDPNETCRLGRPAEWVTTLPALQSMTVEFTVTSSNSTFPADLLDVMSVYNTKLTSLHLLVHCADTTDSHFTVQVSAIPLPSLANLALEFRGNGKLVLDLSAWQLPAIRSLRVDSASSAMAELIVSEKLLNSQLRSFDARNVTWISESLFADRLSCSRLSNLVSLNLEHCYLPSFTTLDACRFPALQQLKLQQVSSSLLEYVTHLREMAGLKVLEQLSSISVDLSLTAVITDDAWLDETTVTVNDSFIPRRDLPLLRSVRLLLCPTTNNIVVLTVNRMAFRALATERLESIDIANVELEEEAPFLRMRNLKRVLVAEMMQSSSFDLLSNLLRHADLAGRLECLSVTCAGTCFWQTAFRDLFLGTYYPLLEDLTLNLPQHDMTTEDAKCMLDNLCLPRIHNLSLSCRSMERRAPLLLLAAPLSLLLVQVSFTVLQGAMPIPPELPKAELDSLRLLKFSSSQPDAMDHVDDEYLVQLIRTCAANSIRIRDIIFDLPLRDLSCVDIGLDQRNGRMLGGLSSRDKLSDLAMVCRRLLTPKELFLVRSLPGLGEYDRFFEYRGSTNS
jgi:hypothetical protein